MIEKFAFEIEYDFLFKIEHVISFRKRFFSNLDENDYSRAKRNHDLFDDKHRTIHELFRTYNDYEYIDVLTCREYHVFDSEIQDTFPRTHNIHINENVNLKIVHEMKFSFYVRDH